MLMRRKRSARKKKMRKKALYQTASLISIAAFGIAQVIPTSNAAFSYSASLKDGQIEAAFVFPETIEGILLEINTQMEKIHASREQADIIYEKLAHAESSEQAISENKLDEVLMDAKSAQEAALNKINELNVYLAQAMLEVQEDESARNILTIIEEALKTATESADSMDVIIKEIEGMEKQATVMITTMVRAEAAAVEKEMIAELAKKALEGLTNSTTLASELLSKYGTEFDLTTYQTLKEELSISETDLEKALEDAETYMNELKAYVDGTKETSTPDVLEEAKMNYEKVQQALDTLKQTMENTRTTNSEVQARIEEEIQKQEEAAKQAQQELENQTEPAGGGGSENQAAPTEGEGTNPDTQPTQDPEAPTSGSGGGAPTQETPPTSGEVANPEIPPTDGEVTNPDTSPVDEELTNPDTPPGDDEEDKNPDTLPGDGEQTPDPTPTEGQETDQETQPGQDNESDQDSTDEDINQNQPARPEDENQDTHQDDASDDDSNNDNNQDDTVVEDQNHASQPAESGQIDNEETVSTEDNNGTDISPDDETESNTEPEEGNIENETSVAESNRTNNVTADNTETTSEQISASQSITRDTVASLHTINNEKSYYSISNQLINRRDEEDENEISPNTKEDLNEDVQSEILTISNSNKVKINFRTYM